MRRAVFAGLAFAEAMLASAAAPACTVYLPPFPLTTVPPETSRTLLVDVLSVGAGRSAPTARLKVVRSSDGRVRSGTIVSLDYLLPLCGGSREPEKGDRLVAYATSDRIVGWASRQEAARFDRRFSPAATPAQRQRR